MTELVRLLMTEQYRLRREELAVKPENQALPTPTGVERALDEALDESFPASDPVAISITRTPNRPA